MSEGFIGRWSRRKADAREGRMVEAEPKLEALPPQPLPSEEEEALAPAPEKATAEHVPAPTLEDVEALTSDSDFSRFVSPEVAPEVKNAALKKLFSDPHFNVMDKLDVYVDDYSKPDPMPETMLRKLAAARFLRLVEDKEQPVASASAARDVADNRGAQSVAQSPEVPEAVPEHSVHDDPDLRLQQDDAAQGPEPGRGTQ